MTGIDRDEVRRALRGIDADHAASVVPWRDALRRIFTDPDATTDPAAARTAVTVGSLGRRRMLTVGGLSVVSAAVLAACGKDKSANPGGISLSGPRPDPAEAPKVVVDDIVLLRTASSLEHVAIDAYQLALDQGLLTDGALIDAAKLFQSHHAEHAGIFEAATRELGGEPFTTHNPVIWDGVVVPATEGESATVTDQGTTLIFAHTLENVAASTYQSGVTLLRSLELRQALMTVGGVEARHAAVLAGVISSAGLVKGSAVVPEMGEKPDENQKIAPVFQVPGPFGSVTGAAGFNSFMTVPVEETSEG